MNDPRCSLPSGALLRLGLSALLAAGSATAPAQTTFKCLDARGRITYSNIDCATQGLKDGGPVAERTMTVPMAVPKSAPPQGAGKPPAKIDPESGPLPPPAQVKPVNPMIEKLLR